MYREIVRCCHTGSRIMLFAFIMCCSVFSGGHGYGAPSYRLMREGYSSATKTLLIAVKNDGDSRSWLATYDEESSSVQRVAIPGNAFPCDFAWAPGRDAFVVTHIEGLTFFQKDDSDDGYKPKAIRYPSNAFSTYCSWSPNGEWLAVYISDRSGIARRWLGLYKFDDKKLVRTGLELDHSHVVWGNDGLLYATNNNSVLTIELKAGEPRVVQTVFFKGNFTLFYGMFGEQPLLLTYDEVRLGDKSLVTLNQPGAKVSVITTETVVFVSSSPGQLAAFDHSGQEISKIDSGRLINFGSIKDPNTVYAIVDSDLVRVCLKKGSLSIDTVSGLHDVTRIE